MDKVNFGQVVSFLFGIANYCLVDVYDVGDYRTPVVNIAACGMAPWKRQSVSAMSAMVKPESRPSAMGRQAIPCIC